MTAPPTDLRRITESDRDFLRIRNRTRRGLAASVDRLVRDLRTGHTDAVTQFTHRHVDLLRAGYLAAHAAGQADYWQGVSRQMHDAQEPPQGLLARRLTFYLPSVVKMATEARSAYQASLARTFADGTPDTTTDALDDWQSDLGVRLLLQADLTWSGMQDGYLDGGVYDPANPFGQVWWNLEPLAQHCYDCPEYADGSPYDPPGSGGNELDATPGDGHTACGASCKCGLSYQPGGNGADMGAVLPKNMPGAGDVGEMAVPAGGTLGDNQKAALDAIRAALGDWEQVRGDLPALPNVFDADSAADLPDWETLSPDQQAALEALLRATVSWNVATNLAALSEPMRFYNPRHEPAGSPIGGQFAPRGGSAGGGGGHIAGVTHVGHHEAGMSGGGSGAQHFTITLGTEGETGLHSLFGRHLSASEIGSLVGAPHGAAMKVYGAHGIVNVEVRGPTLSDGKPMYAMIRSFVRHGDDIVCENYSIALHPSLQKSGLGTEIFAEQVAGLRKLGVDHIVTTAARNFQANGYYTWARLGYDNHLGGSVRASLRQTFGNRGLGRAKTIQDLMRTPVGRSWWRAHGSTWSGNFDLHNGSLSMKVLRTYLRRKGINVKLREMAGHASVGANRFPIVGDALRPSMTLPAQWPDMPTLEEIPWTDEDEQAADAAMDEINAEDGYTP